MKIRQLSAAALLTAALGAAVLAGAAPASAVQISSVTAQTVPRFVLAGPFASRRTCNDHRDFILANRPVLDAEPCEYTADDVPRPGWYFSYFLLSS
ncbi:hypothetical protein [Streptosporangium sp. NPDC051022]|uniref:hypothetical protein n=1 Tax=Streptosporangium sp. NPDC051022 TaxID=3155752 RepID=UPI003448284D